MALALTNCDIYTGDEVLSEHALVVSDGTITDVIPFRDVPSDVEVLNLDGQSVAPGFIDLQVNGGGDALFNDDPSRDQIRRIVLAHRQFGTTDILPTYITGPVDGMLSAIGAVEQYEADGLEGVLGIHFEGPAINAAKAGVHDKHWIRTDHLEELLTVYHRASERLQAVLVTLAPEVVGHEFVHELRSCGVRVAAGHTDATGEQITAALDQGLSLGTHVWNAMSPLTSRDPGVVGALLHDDRVWCDFIADGYHVDFTTLSIAVRAKPRGRAFLVTDAMSPVGGKRGGYRLGPFDVRVEEGRCVTEDGTLAGSALDLATAVRNCIQIMGVPKDEALRMASLYPAQYLGVDDRLGRIRRGYKAHIAVFDNEIHVSNVLVEGELQSASLG